MSLKQRAIKGTFWSFTEQLSVKGINFIVQIFLARLLAPKDFGLIAMMTIFITIGSAIVGGGMTQSLIRTPKANDRDFSTVFYINIVVSFFVYGVIYIVAPYIAGFYSQPLLNDLVRVYSLVIPIKAFMAVQNTILIKQMDFKTLVFIQTPSILISGIIAIYLAHKNFGAWALVYMQIIQAILMTLQYWFYSEWKPKLIFDKTKFYGHFNFGYKLTLNTFLNSFFNELYNIIIGRHYTSATLGLYNRAYTFQNLPGFIFARALNKITYPLFSEFQKDNKTLKSIYKDITSQMMVIYTPIMVFFMYMSESFLGFLLTDKWLEAAPFLTILSIAGLSFPIQSYNYNILKAKGKSGEVLKLNTISKALTIIGILVVLPYGIYPLVIFQSLMGIVTLLLFAYSTGIVINYSVIHQLRDLLPIVLISILCGFMGYIISNSLVADKQYFLIICVYFLCFSVFYFGILTMYKYTPFMKLLKLSKSLIK